MRNAFFPPQLYNFGNNEVEMPNLDFTMQQHVDNIITNVHGSGFSMESARGFAVSCSTNHQQGFDHSITSSSSNSSNCDYIYQQSLLLSRKHSLPQFNLDFESLLPQEGDISDVFRDKTALKKKKLNTQWHHHASTEIQQHSMPVKRSQKLSDKITSLQKLVSPYGKTDTASVLQEASLYIKLLQVQIQNLYQMLSSSYKSVIALHSQDMEEEEKDLRSRGLCLVPISLITQKVTSEDLVDPHNISSDNHRSMIC